jgi:Periplasmic binding protein
MFSLLTLVRKSAGRAVGRLAALATCAALAACGPTVPGAGGAPAGRGGTVQVALLVPSGSGQASDELIAASLQNAARLAINDLGAGVKIDLKVYSTAGQPAQAAAMATQAVNEGAQIILGPLYAAEANAAGVAVASRGVNVLSFSNNADIAGGNVFVLGSTFRNTAQRLASYARQQGVDKIMIVHDQNQAGEVGRAAIAAGVSQAGGSVVGTGSYEFSQSGIATAIPGIAAEARDSGAEGIFFTADSAGALPLVTQLLKDNRVDPATVRFIGLTRWDIPQATVALPSVQGGWFALPDPSLYAQFTARYKAAYSADPHGTAGLAYDGIAAIGALVSQGNANALSAAALTQGQGFVGVNGVFRLLADGTNQRGLAIAQIQNNQVTIIDPAPRSFGGLGS